MGWIGELREFRQVGRVHTLVWRIKVEGDTETTWHGVLDGKLQSTSHTYSAINVGKANEISARVYALSRAERKVLLKRREGYLEYHNGRPTEDPTDSLDPLEDLPQSLSFYKPDNSLSATLRKKLRAGEALFGRKRNGMMYVIRFLEDEVEIYSRRMLRGMHLEDRTWEERFGHIYEEALARLMDGDIPPNTLLLGELIMDRRGNDDFTHVQSVTKSKTDEAIAAQEKGGKLSYYVWDVAQWDGDILLTETPISERLDIVQEYFDDWDWLKPLELWTVNDVWDQGIEAVLAAHPNWMFRKQRSEVEFKAVFSNREDTVGHAYYLDGLAQEVAKALKWEGWVIVDPAGVFGDRGMNFRGKPDRPGKYSGKLKPEWEDDFILEWDPEEGFGSYGTGKNQGLVGSFALYQLNKAGEPVYICDVSGGIKDKKTKDYRGLTRDELSNRGIYPLVAEVSYAERTYISAGDKTNALMFPRITRFRDDKDPEECINHKL